eukprot:TRINITY_DN164_c0_g1_i3.p1 TRINITY_DN164_c0_g1~~TRINITY_DN164_c0_g1_i3.p1  ORF type:complete len:196 (+),score=44.79 TRINITY_DN164_c0_g1_i3:28-588(+)
MPAKKESSAVSATKNPEASSPAAAKPAANPVEKKAAKPAVKKATKKTVVGKALKAKKTIEKGKTPKNYRVRTNVHFRRPRTRIHARNPKYPRQSIPRRNKLDEYAILKHPLTTESTMKKIEDHNTLVFVVDIKATKKTIADSVRKLYDVRPFEVRTVITPKAVKKAFVKLREGNDALDVAHAIGII